MTPQERHAYDEHLSTVMIQNDVLDTAKLEGRIEGLAEGRADGRVKEKLENAKRMKDKGCAIDFIAEITGLSIEEIENL